MVRISQGKPNLAVTGLRLKDPRLKSFVIGNALSGDCRFTEELGAFVICENNCCSFEHFVGNALRSNKH